MEMNRKHAISPSKGLILLWGIAVVAWWVRYFPPIGNLFVFDDDARQHVYWTARFIDPGLFPNDLLTDFISSKLFDPIGYQLLYKFGTHLAGPLLFSQVLTLVLLLVSLWFLEMLLSSEVVSSAGGRFFCGLLFLFFSLYTYSGGLPRTFAYPLLLGFLVLLQKGMFNWAALTVVVQAAFYPPIMPNALALASVSLLVRFVRGERGRRWIASCVILGAVVVGIWLGLSAVYDSGAEKIAGPRVTLEEARQMPEFHQNGRSAFFKNDALHYWLLGRSGIGARYLIGFVLIFLIVGSAAGWRNGRIPAISIHLVWTSLALFGAAHAVLFALHLPSRYTLYTLPLAMMIAIGAYTGPFVEAVRRSKLTDVLKRNSRLVRRIGWGALAVVSVIYIYLQSTVIPKADSLIVALDPQDMEMLSFVGSLPKDALVAGFPLDMDNAPLVSRRAVLVNCELSIPYYTRYYGTVKKRLMDVFKAYYSDRWEDVEAFVERYGVTALVVNKTRFNKAFLDGPIYFEPFGSLVKRNMVKRTMAKRNMAKKDIDGAGSFALGNPPENRRCFENSRYIILCWENKGGS